MKTFKYIVSLLPALLLCAMLQSCDKDGDLLYTDGTGSAAINGTDTDIVLDYNNLSALALTIYWNENGDITRDYMICGTKDGAWVVLEGFEYGQEG